MNLVINSQFRPFTYDEMVKPLVQYKGAYDKVEQDYSDLAAQTEMWKDIVNQTNSPEAYAMYKSYSDRLNSIVDDFSKGMNLRNRSALIGMKRRYASEIKPIEEAYNRRTALAEEQRKAELNNPTMLWQRRASEMSLDDFINNPTADYGKSTSGAALSAQVAAGAGALAKEFRDNPDKMRKLVGGDYFEYVKQRGFSSEAVLAAIANNPDASPVLTNLVESTINSSGIREWGDASTLQQAYNYARQGLWQAIGQSESQIVQNWRAQENLSHSHAMARQSAAHQMDLEKAYLTQTATPYVKSDGTVGYYQPITKNSNGTYSRTPTPTDAAVGNPRGDNSSGTTGTDTPGTGNNRYVPGTDITPQKMRSAMINRSQDKMKELGYNPSYAIAYTSYGGKGYTGNQGWTAGTNGADHPGLTGWAFNTNSNLITKWGNFTTRPINNAETSWVENITALPAPVQQELAKLNIPDDVDIQIQRVKRDGVNEGVEYDYLVYVRNN